MKQLLIEEMKRAIAIMESRDNLEKYRMEKVMNYNYPMLNRDIKELQQLLLMIRKHSILLEKEIVWKTFSINNTLDKGVNVHD